MNRAGRFLAIALLAGAAMAAGGVFPAAAAQPASLADMQRELENLERQEAGLAAWLTDVENIMRDASGRDRATIYTPAYLEAMQQSLASVREKRLALSRELESERQRSAAPN